MAVKTAHDLGVFARLSQTTSSVTCKELAAGKNADTQLVGTECQYLHWPWLEILIALW